jgi:uncharacterized pyridoxal phosphate-containing UPF0001 family protein
MSLSQQNAIEQNLQNVREKIAAAAQLCGRSSEEITLLAVSKTKPVSADRRSDSRQVSWRSVKTTYRKAWIR